MSSASSSFWKAKGAQAVRVVSPGAAVQIGWSKAGELSARPERAGVREAAVPNVYG